MLAVLVTPDVVHSAVIHTRTLKAFQVRSK